MQQYVSELESLGFSYRGQPGALTPKSFPSDVLDALRQQAAEAARRLGKSKAFIRYEAVQEARVFEKPFASENEAASFWIENQQKVEDFNRELSQRVQKFVQSDPEVVEKDGKWLLRLKVFLGGPKIVLGD